MKKLEKLEKKYKELGEEIERLKNEGKAWKPKNGESFWWLSGRGTVDICDWYDNCFNNEYYQMGNCFKTREEAKVISEKIKIYTELKRLAEEINTEPIDWGNSNQKKYAICCIHKAARRCDMKQEDWNVTQLANVVYSTNKDFFEIAKERIGEDRLLKLFKE